MKIQHYTAVDFKTSKWSGGTTTQLFISPQTANYADLNFDIRISSAKVEVDTSTFTNLPKVSRKLMILDGEITIKHQDRYTKQLKPLDVDTFQGDWNTSSQGICTDFNVMTTKNHVSQLHGVALNAEEIKQINNTEKWDIYCIYLHSGKISVTIADKHYTINSDNLLVIEQADFSALTIHAQADSKLAIVSYNHQS